MEPLVVVGYAVRYPHEAASVEQFWDFLVEARESSAPAPQDRLNSTAFYHPDPDHGGTFHAKRAHFLKDDPKGFDAAFFKMSKTELLSLDPQHRLVMENVYHALENAGVTMENAVSSNTSVFVNGYNHDHANNINLDPEVILKYKPTGTDNSLTSGRVSWFYDFRGPSLTIDTACSGSLVGLHLACQSLKDRESDMAVVSGVNVIGSLPHMIGMSYSGFMGSEGKCFSFDHRADGYARGEGVGTVIVKRLSDAVDNRDIIRAVIRGTGLNHDGRTPGITYPSLSSQEDLIRKTYRRAGLDTADTCYIESHGTGTQAGDFVEASAISRGFETSSRNMPLYIGALKSNIGHLEGGSGIAGLIKTIMILENGIIPPNVNFERANLKIPVDEWSLKFPTKPIPWPHSGARRASVSCFGLNGTNSHCILDDAAGFLKARGVAGKHRTVLHSNTNQIPTSIISNYVSTQDDVLLSSKQTISNARPDTRPNGDINTTKAPTQLFTISAFNEKAFSRVVSQLADYLSHRSHLSIEEERKFLHDLAFTLSERRTRFSWSACLLASSVSQLHQRLAEGTLKPCHSRTPPRLGFVFTGQGAQYAGMGKQLLGYPVFHRSLEHADACFQSLGCTWRLIDELIRDTSNTRVDEPAIAHPSSTAIQIALVDLLKSWGITPSRVLGHSSGEIAAAYCAGKISREAAWRVAYFRGQAVYGPTSRDGAMMAVGLSPSDLQPYLEEVQSGNPDGVLTIACFNSPKNQTVSGDAAMIDDLKKRLDANHIFARKLAVGKAYHSPHMKTFTENYQHAMGSLQDLGETFDSRSVDMFSTLTGKKVHDSFLDSSYWCANMVGSVQFEQALRSFCNSAIATQDMGPAIDEIVEIGAHGALRSAIKETTDPSDSITYWSTLDRNSPDAASLLQTVAGLSSRGYPAKLSEINQVQNQCEGWDFLPDLPPYPFDHASRDIYESRLAKNLRLREHPRHDIFGAPTNDWDPQYPRFRHFLRLRESPWLKEYMLHGRYVYPPAGFLVMAIESSMKMADKRRPNRGIHVYRVAFKALLAIPDNVDGVEISLSYAPADDGSGMSRFHVSSYDEIQEQWIEHCSGYISIDYDESEAALETDRQPNTRWLNSLRDSVNQLTKSLDCKSIFEKLASSGLQLGSLFQQLSNAKISGNHGGHGLATVEVPDISSIMPEHYMHPHMIHPVTLQNMLSLTVVAVNDLSESPPELGIFMPRSIENLWISSKVTYKPHAQFRCFCTATAAGENRHCQIHVLAEPSLSEIAVSVSGIHLARHISDEDLSKSPTIPRFYSTEWQPDINLVTNQLFDSLVNKPEDADSKYDSECELFTDLQLAATLLSTDALFDMKGLDLTGLEPHYHRFYDFLKHIAADVLTNAIPRVPFKLWEKYAQNNKLKAKLYKKVEARNSDGALLVRVGTRIPAFFRRELDPLHIMFGQDDLMAEYYDDDFKIGSIQEKLRQYLTLFRWNKSNLSVLEVGAGTGSFTAQVLTHLSPPHAERSISEYVFTDLSPGFFEKAKKRLRPWSDIVAYKKFDVGIGPLSQGFELAAFDLIIASNVLHATPNLHDTLRNIHSLLKPGGKLVFHEGVRQDALWTNISFSPLSGWWLGTEPERRWCPYIPTEIWNDYLHRAGFSGVDLEFPSSDYPEFSKISLMVSTALREGPNAVPDHVEELILVLPDSKEPTILKEIECQMNQLRIVLSIHTLSEVSTLDISGKTCLALLETDMPLLSPDGLTAFGEIRDLLLRCRNLIWISGDPVKDPSFDIATGLIRSMRHAAGKDDKNIVTVSVSTTEPIDKSLAEAICKIFRHQFLSPGLTQIRNAEYYIENGFILTSRVSPNQDATMAIRSGFSSPQAVPTPWNEVHRPLKLVNRQSHGSNLELVWVSDDFQSETLGDDEVDIDIKAVSLRNRDLLASKGQLPQEGLGGEASGVITRVGPAVKDLHKGARVICFSDWRQGREGALRSVVRTSSLLVAPIPDDLSFEAAATLIADWVVAICSLKHIGMLGAREKILVHDASGSIGQAAIRYAQSVDADVFVAVSCTTEKEHLMREYGLLEDHIFYARLPFLSNQIKQRIPEGVNMVLSFPSNRNLTRTIDYIAPFGKIIEVISDMKSGMPPAVDHPSSVIYARVDAHSFARRPSMVEGALSDIRHLLSQQRTYHGPSAKVLSYGQLHEGLQALQDGTVDSVILQPANDIVPVVPEASRPSRLEKNGSYIIIGDLNSLRLKMGMRMRDRGARHLIFLSTSPSSEPKDGDMRRMLDSLENQGCTVHLHTCNFSDKAEFHHMLTELSQQLPPVRGVIYQPHESHPVESARRCYQGIRELWFVHQMFAAVDYFVVISPIKGLDGLCTESESHTTRTFQDAVVRHRVSLGLHSASIDLGDLNDDDALAVIDYVVSSRNLASLPSSQIISGFPGPFASDGQQAIPAYLSDPLFQQLPVSKPRGKSADSPTERKLSVAELLQSSNGSDHAGRILSREMRRKLSNLLNISEDEISEDHNIRENGVDSLIEMEFQNWVDKELKISLPSEDLISKSISELSAQIVSASPLVQHT